ncbi:MULTISPECIES: SCO2523 family variant P-loop protein [Glycomyces]|uniref:CobQ/CobB/MinD/ParA family nucleotide binding protein n=1 Tax=Glycomyces artemisiae TaxID=1076443 RepID=A0A2T0UUX6_9ACTN|nr:SCO2523 family variant P-loop protein [Glycomyces artemisiae]NUQ87393.1 ParA family protein [Glycomyces artemisiae]PRY61731.1 CobQ/CobB/MinD/ParA family nucleotide binding protein [Glycomyces artemisiae]
MLLFATSDKGGTGRSVSSCNLAYRRAVQGMNVCYVDFDFGSPTAGAVFGIDDLEHGTYGSGIHEYLQDHASESERYSVWEASDRAELQARPDGAGELVLCPGDADGSEFPGDENTVDRCVKLLQELSREFDLVIVDLSAGRSHATEMVMAATARPELANLPWRWIVYHRWTKQHVIAAHSLVYGERGLVETARSYGEEYQRKLLDSIRYVRTAVVDPDGADLKGLEATQIRWLRRIDADLHQMAVRLKLGRMNLLGSVPLDPVLQWREQIITDADAVTLRIANQATVRAFSDLASRSTEEQFAAGLEASVRGIE